MTVRAHLLACLADIEEKKKRNGLTSGLIVQQRETQQKLASLSTEELEKEYIPRERKQNDWRFHYGF